MSYSVDLVCCRERQQRLLAHLHAHDIELAIVTQREHVQWLTGLYYSPLFQPVAAMNAAGHVTLVIPQAKATPEAAADAIEFYDAKWLSTLRNDQRAASSKVLLAALGSAGQPRRLGVEFSTFCPHLAAGFARSETLDIEPDLYRLRRFKHPDELVHLRKANEANRAMYEHARSVLKPGLNELDLYGQLHAVAVEVLGGPLTFFGQDFQCNSRGGPPRDRRASAGELYILDLGVGNNGYFSDNARTLCVGGRPTDKQQEAWEQIQKVFTLVELIVKPGVRCRELFERAESILNVCPHGVFNHHLGHGVGLFPHEAPHLNPNWDDTFAEGDFFACEPGLYGDGLNHGMRLENNYLVTADGVELQTPWPIEL